MQFAAPVDHSAETVEGREAAFWDAQAAARNERELREETVPVTESDRCRLRLLGELSGRRVLDAGCGTGLWACHMASQGARVWAVDISPASVEMVRRRAELLGVSDRVHPVVMSVTELRFPDQSFDVVHGQDIIHHVDAVRFGREVARVLVPGGHAVFSENSANNPLLMLARSTLCGRFGVPKWSSEDEYPLTRAKRRQFGAFFKQTQVEYPEFLCMHYLDAKLFGYRNPHVSRLCRGIDRGVHHWLPFLRAWSYRQLLRFSGPQRSVPPEQSNTEPLVIG